MPGMTLPSGFGGLLRYDEEYQSKYMLKPTHVLVFIALVIVFRLVLGWVF